MRAYFLISAALRQTLAATVLVVLGLSACSRPSEKAWSGYAEAQYVYVAAPIGGQLQQIATRTGATVRLGQPLFTLDSVLEHAAQDEAGARLASAQAQSADLARGRQADEIAAIQAQIVQAQAAVEWAHSDWQRQHSLAQQGFVAAAKVESAQTALTQAQARLEELQANVRSALAPGRIAVRQAQDANTQAARAVLAQAQWRAQQKQQFAPVDATVADVFFQVGETVAAGQAVVSLLPPANLKARFYVPETDLAGLHAGDSVRIDCDGCGTAMAARVSRIATQPEYTPPVIYSNAQRSKLVFMVEALPDPDAALRLKPGQPVTVHR